MSSRRYVLALDEGSSSARSVLIDEGGTIVSDAFAPVVWERPRSGWVELDPRRLWETQLDTIHRAMASGGIRASEIAACGVTTHRETVMIWDRRTGEPVHNAIVWLSSQTDDIIARWQAEGIDQEFRRRTGLRNDSYFSAGKLAWLLEEVPGVRPRAEAGHLVCGTVDCWLLWCLTGGASHLTDHSCASRTALFNLQTLKWDDDLCDMLGIPRSLFPDAVASDSDFGVVHSSVLPGSIPIRAILADQQASMYGHACFAEGVAKNTFGTAGALTVNVGTSPVHVDGVTTSVAWTAHGQTWYEAEGVVFHSGQTLQWLRDRLGLLADSTQIDALASSVPDNGGVYLVPAFTGLCAPYWDRRARASIVGMSLETERAHIVRAAVESMAYLTVDIIRALERGGLEVPTLKVDGGAAKSDLLCQFLADVSGMEIHRPQELERTALGVGFLAGISVGMWDGPHAVQAAWREDRVFGPHISDAYREHLYGGWLEAIDRTLTTPAHAAGAHVQGRHHMPEGATT